MSDDRYEISADAARVNAALVHHWLSTDAYRALGRPCAVQDSAIAASLNFGAYDRATGAQVACARVVTDHATYHCSRTALADDALASVPATVTFGSFSSWVDWMKMGDRPGTMVSRAAGRKVARLEDMPSRFLDILRSRYPDLARDPAAALDRPPFSFSP